MSALIYAIAWLLFATIHSLLARTHIQKRLEYFCGRWYRLLYNLFALLCILAVFLTGLSVLDNRRFEVLDHPTAIYCLLAVKALGLFVLLAALMRYDLGRFSGITQVRTGESVSENTNEPLVIEGLNKRVRHPLYTGLFLLLWGNATSEFALWTALWGSVYLVIGTLFEERKLLRIYGESYKNYQRRTPRYIPNINDKTQ